MTDESPLRVVMADDEATARRRVRRLLEAMDGVTVVAECATGDEALAALREHQPDVAVLDIQMPGLSGLDVAKLAASTGAAVLLVTAHTEYALDAYDAGVVDYVRKPVDAARLQRALDRCRERQPPASAPTLPRVALGVRGEVRLVPPASITHALLDGHLVTVFVADAGPPEALLTEQSMAELGRRLDALGARAGARIERVHRRALLNLDRVARLRPLDTGGYVAITDTGAEVPVSRQAARGLRKRLGLG